MKAGQLVSFIFETLPDDAQAALATLQADAAPMAPSLGGGGGRVRARRRPRARVPRLERPPGGGGQHRPGPSGGHARGRRRCGQGPVPGRRRRDRERPRRGRGDVRDVLGDDAQGARRQGPRRRVAGTACARSSTTRSRRATWPSSSCCSPDTRGCASRAWCPSSRRAGCSRPNGSTASRSRSSAARPAPTPSSAPAR